MFGRGLISLFQLQVIWRSRSVNYIEIPVHLIIFMTTLHNLVFLQQTHKKNVHFQFGESLAGAHSGTKPKGSDAKGCILSSVPRNQRSGPKLSKSAPYFFFWIDFDEGFCSISCSISITMAITRPMVAFRVVRSSSVSKHSSLKQPNPSIAAMPLRDMPGPPVLANLARYAREGFRNHHTIIEKLFEQYGPTFQFAMPGKKVVYVCDPDDVERVFRAEGYPSSRGDLLMSATYHEQEKGPPTRLQWR